MPLTPADFARELRARGATDLCLVTFRNNRSTVWSLTRRGTALNVHSAFRDAPPEILDDFAVLASEGGIRSRAGRKAADRVRTWPPLLEAIEVNRLGHALDGRLSGRPTSCCATEEQRAYLRALYRYLNRTRFDGTLPDDIPVRLSRRMKSALGHMRPGEDPAGERFVAEIALNVDLLLPENGPERVDTLLHEMAHAADYLETGNRGHGSSWRAWARKVGCRPTTLYDRPVRFRRNRKAAIRRVPPLPLPLQAS